MKEKTIIDRIMDNISVCDNGCWEWQGNKTRNGYGRIHYEGRKQFVHRIMTPGKPTEEEPYSLHSCDNPACCRPEHLSWGNNSRNTKEKRDRLGTHASQKITREDAYKIKFLEKGLQREIADRYGISQMQVSLIRAGGTWRDLEYGEYK